MELYKFISTLVESSEDLSQDEESSIDIEANLNPEGEVTGSSTPEVVAGSFSKKVNSVLRKYDLISYHTLISATWSVEDPELKKQSIDILANRLIDCIMEIRSTPQFLKYMEFKRKDVSKVMTGEELKENLKISLIRQSIFLWSAYKAYSDDEYASPKQISKEILNFDYANLPGGVEALKLRNDKILKHYEEMLSESLFLKSLVKPILFESVKTNEPIDIILNQIMPAIVKLFCISYPEEMNEVDYKIRLIYSHPSNIEKLLGRSRTSDASSGNRETSDEVTLDKLKNKEEDFHHNKNIKSDFYNNTNYLIILNELINKWNKENKFEIRYKEPGKVYPAISPLFLVTNSAGEVKAGPGTEELSLFTVDLLILCDELLMDDVTHEFLDLQKEDILIDLVNNLKALAVKDKVYEYLFYLHHTSNDVKQQIASILGVEVKISKVVANQLTKKVDTFRDKIKIYLEVNKEELKLKLEDIQKILAIQNNDEFVKVLKALATREGKNAYRTMAALLSSSEDSDQYSSWGVAKRGVVTFTKIASEIFVKLATATDVFNKAIGINTSKEEYIKYIEESTPEELEFYISQLKNYEGPHGKNFEALHKKTQNFILLSLEKIVQNKKGIFEAFEPLDSETPDKKLERALLIDFSTQLFAYSREFLEDVHYLALYLTEYSALYSSNKVRSMLINKKINSGVAKYILDLYLKTDKESIIDVSKYTREQIEIMRKNKRNKVSPGVEFTHNETPFTLEPEE